jgi:hypothetical protein
MFFTHGFILNQKPSVVNRFFSNDWRLASVKKTGSSDLFDSGPVQLIRDNYLPDPIDFPVEKSKGTSKKYKEL